MQISKFNKARNQFNTL